MSWSYLSECGRWVPCSAWLAVRLASQQAERVAAGLERAAPIVRLMLAPSEPGVEIEA